MTDTKTAGGAAAQEAAHDASVRRQRVRLWSFFSLTVVVGIAALSVYFILHYAGEEEERDLLAWQTRLGLVAETRAADVDAWLTGQRDALARFAALPAVGLYADELINGDATGGDRSAVEAYLQNAVRLTAGQAGWADSGATAEGQGPGARGLAVVGAGGRILATAGSGIPPAALAAALAQGTAALLESRTAQDVPVLLWLAPIYSQQAPDKPIAMAVAERPLADVLPLLRQPGDSDETAVTELLRRDGETFSILAAMGPGGPAQVETARRYDTQTAELASAFAMRQTGAFGMSRRYDGAEVLVTSRAVAALPWVVARSISLAEALGPERARRTSLSVIVVLAALAALVVLLLIWRHAASIRIGGMAADATRRATDAEDASRFLQAIVDRQPTAILALDAGGAVRFANARAAAEVGMTPATMLGRTLPEIYGKARALPLIEASAKAHGTHAPAATQATEEADSHVLTTLHLPLSTDPAGGEEGTLILREDVTALTAERARREDTLKGVMRMLLTLIDRRDPFAADQSMRVAEVARSLAEELALGAPDIDTVTYAAALMNIGKILVDSDILTRPAPLAAHELVSVQAALNESAALVGEVDFDGPVAQTIALCHIFGTEAPGEDAEVALMARIVAAANMFVALVSPRAWRQGLNFDAAMAELKNRAATGDDRRIVSALQHVLDNRGGRRRWQHFSKPSVKGLS